MLGPAGYGTIALVGIVATLVFTASTAWTGIAVRRYGREDLEVGRTMNRLTWNRALIGAPLAAISVAAVLTLKFIGALPSSLTWPLVWIAIGSALVTMVVDHWVCMLETSGKMKVSAGSQVASQVLYVGILVALFVIARRASPQIVLMLALGCSCLLAIGVAPVLWRLGVVPPSIDRTLLRRMLRLSTPMIAFTVSQYVLASVDIVVLRMFRSQADVGVYAVAYQAYTVLSRVAVSATAVFVPLFVSLEMAGRRNLIERHLRRGVPQGTFLLAATGGLAIPLLPLLVPVMFGHRFEAAATPLSILALGLLCLFAGYLVSPILTLHEDTRAIAAITVVAAVINVAGDTLMIGVLHMGIIAPAIATSGALAFVFAVFYARAQQALDQDVRFDAWVVAPMIAGLVPTLAWGGVLGAVTGIAGAAVASAGIIMWRSPFSREDADLIAKLDLPEVIKRGVVKVIMIGSP
jgi:O-antigen/teichoic acid export membrane protein